MEFKDYYSIMGVPRDAGEDEIKRTYRRLARKYHPDVSKEADAEARFKELGEAYEVLRDPQKRAAYDQLGPNWKAGQEFRPPPGWNQGFDVRGGGPGNGFSDFFESLFGRGFSARAYGGAHARRGQDSQTRILIDIEDAYRGATRSVSLRLAQRDASGRPAGTPRTLSVRIPRGVRQGQRIRLAGQGSAGPGGAGDLYLEVDFNHHRLYRVEGADVHLTLPVAPWEAALGATVQVPTPAGPVDLKIPPGSAGRKLRLRGRGIPAQPPGDLYVTLEVALPPADSEAARAAWRSLRDSLDFDPRADLE